MQRGANLLGDGLRPVDQLHVRHRRIVAVAEAALEEPQVAARAALVARAALDAQLPDRLLVAHAREGEAEVAAAVGLARGDTRLGATDRVLRVRPCGLCTA